MSNWINVKDFLPDKDGQYIVYCLFAVPDEPLVTIARYNHGFGFSALPLVWLEAITHWIPLPEPPRKKKVST